MTTTRAQRAALRTSFLFRRRRHRRRSRRRRHRRRRHHRHRRRRLTTAVAATAVAAIDAGCCSRDQEGRDAGRRGEAGGGGGRQRGPTCWGRAHIVATRSAPQERPERARPRSCAAPRRAPVQPLAHPRAHTVWAASKAAEAQPFRAACANWVRVGSSDVFARSGTSFWASRIAFLWRPACPHGGSEYPRVRAFSSQV